jgi:hypothetical protein
MGAAIADNGIHAPVGLKAHDAVRTWPQGRRQRFAVVVNGLRVPEPPGSDDALVDHFVLSFLSSKASAVYEPTLPAFDMAMAANRPEAGRGFSYLWKTQSLVHHPQNAHAESG